MSARSSLLLADPAHLSPTPEDGPRSLAYRLPRGSLTAEAIRYALNHHDGLVRFLNDGRIELDANTVERAIRPICLSRKNALFASGDEGGTRWAAVASLVETCKLNGIDPQRYFTEALTRLINGWPNNRIDELMPWRWADAGKHKT
jgi:transposase